jgi:hypothetical protein
MTMILSFQDSRSDPEAQIFIIGISITLISWISLALLKFTNSKKEREVKKYHLNT